MSPPTLPPLIEALKATCVSPVYDQTIVATMKWVSKAGFLRTVKPHVAKLPGATHVLKHIPEVLTGDAANIGYQVAGGLAGLMVCGASLPVVAVCGAAIAAGAVSETLRERSKREIEQSAANKGADVSELLDHAKSAAYPSAAKHVQNIIELSTTVITTAANGVGPMGALGLVNTAWKVISIGKDLYIGDRFIKKLENHAKSQAEQSQRHQDTKWANRCKKQRKRHPRKGLKGR